MCNVGDDNFEENENIKYMPLKQQLSLSNKCNKCRQEKPCVVLRSKDKYCKNCFLGSTVHKFKSILGKHKLIRPNDRVLIAFRGGHASTALLHFIRTGLDLETHKKLRFQPEILFLEDNLHLNVSEREELLQKVEIVAKNHDFKIYFTSLPLLVVNQHNIKESIFEKSSDLKLQMNDKDTLKEILIKQSNETQKNDLIHILKRNFLIEIAKYLKINIIFTTELSQDVASQLLTDLSLGRGSQAPLNTGFCDFRDSDIKILRPLRLFDKKELAFYNYFHNLFIVSFKEPVKNPYGTVQDLMNKFVSDLQTNYPATITTVLKTGDKLGIVDNLRKCSFCKAPLQEDSSVLSSSESTNFSHYISTQALSSHHGSYNNFINPFLTVNEQKYCFSCQKLIKV